MMLGNKAAESVVPSGAKFKDVAANAWYAKYIEYLASVSIMQGDEKGNANPDGALTAIDFAKMLLVSLGYDPKVEGLVGVDYRINTSKLANLVGLFNGNKDVVATNPVTREEAALYTFNAVKSPLVEYASKGSTLTVNGAELNFGATNYKYVVSTLAKEQRISDRKLTNTGTTSDGGYTVEFGERYYEKLQLKKTTDDFGRPANKWIYDNKDVGTYVNKDQLLASYTKAVKGQELWELLGNDKIDAGKLTYFIDGFENATDTGASSGTPFFTKTNMAKGNTANYGCTGKGVLTEVYEDGDDLIIVCINTYMAKAKNDFNATKKELTVEAYRTPFMTAGTDVNYRTNFQPMSFTAKAEDFANVADYKKDTPLKVTMAWDPAAGAYEIKSVEIPEFTTDSKVTKYSTGDNYLVTGGEQKDYAKRIYLAPDQKTNTASPLSQYDVQALTDYSYNISYDSYGYVLGVEIYEGESKFVFLAGYDFSGTNIAAGEATGYLIFSDGTTKTAKINTENTNKNLTNSATGALKDPDYPLLSNANVTDAKAAQYNMWFTYTEKSGVYTLKPVQYWLVRENASPANTNINPASVQVTGTVGKYAGTASLIGYGNDNSTYITVESGEVSNGKANNIGIKKVTGTYTGVQKVDLKPFEARANGKDVNAKKWESLGAGNIFGADAAGGTLTNPGDFFAVLNSDRYIIAAIVVGEDVGSSANYAYVVKTAKNEYIKDDYYYWEFDAIYEGELKTMTVKEHYDRAISNNIQNVVGNYTAGNTLAALNTGAYQRSALFKLALDKDGFVVGATQVLNNDPKMFGNANQTFNGANSGVGNTPIDTANQRLWDTYNSDNDTVPTRALKAIGRTLYTIDDATGNYDIGLAIAPGAPIFVIQRVANAQNVNLNNPKVEKYDDLDQALAALEDRNGVADGVLTAARVTAVLNDNGTAKWVVIKSAVTYNAGGTRVPSVVGNSEVKLSTDGSTYGVLKAGQPLKITAGNLTSGLFDVYVGSMSVAPVTVYVAPGTTSSTNINVAANVTYFVVDSWDKTIIGGATGKE
jgi:hypothetical protein